MDILWIDDKGNGNPYLRKEFRKLKLSVEYVMFDHRSRWRNFCDFVGFIEV